MAANLQATAQPSRASASVTPEQIALLARSLAERTETSIEEMKRINANSNVLALNAQIEAARSQAAAFGVVAREMRELSNATAHVAASMESETQGAVVELERISRSLGTNVRGTRLTDLALMNIDLIDRCLYERSCDCRWWATDASLVSALTTPSAETVAYASKRMGVILNAYTVYFDLVLADLNGRIVANGRPNLYSSVGQEHKTAPWFRSAMQTASGDEFGFQSVTESTLVNKQRSLIYSCGVRSEGESRGKLLGVLGIVFNWDALAQTIVENTPLCAQEKASSRVCIVDAEGLVLADTRQQQLREKIRPEDLDGLFDSRKDFRIKKTLDGATCIAHALSPGFETYATGWHSLIFQQLAQ